MDGQDAEGQEGGVARVKLGKSILDGDTNVRVTVGRQIVAL